MRAIPDLLQVTLSELLGVSFLRLIDGKMANMSQPDLLKKKIRLICEQNQIQMEVVKQRQIKDR